MFGNLTRLITGKESGLRTNQVDNIEFMNYPIRGKSFICSGKSLGNPNNPNEIRRIQTSTVESLSFNEKENVYQFETISGSHYELKIIS